MLIEKMVWLLIKMEVCTVAVKNSWLIFILTVGVFGIINTEMGVMGILPLLAEKFSVSITQAGLLISLFALAVALAGPVMPLVFAGFDRKKVMLLVLGVFVTSNIVALVTDDFVADAAHPGSAAPCLLLTGFFRSGGVCQQGGSA